MEFPTEDMADRFIDTILSTLFWEFMRFAGQRVRDPNLLSDNAKLQKKAGIPISETWDLARPEIIRALETVSPILFLDFIKANTQILGKETLFEWVRERAPNLPKPGEEGDELKRPSSPK